MNNSIVFISDIENINKLLNKCRKKKLLALDVGWEEGSFKRFKIKYVAFSYHKNITYFLNIDESNQNRLRIINKIGNFIFHSSCLKIGYDLKNVYTAFRQYGILVFNKEFIDRDELGKNFFDIKIGAYLLQPDVKLKSFKSICKRYKFYNVNFAYSDDKSEAIPPTCVLLLLYKRMLAKLKATGLDRLFTKIEMPLVEILSFMEAKGMSIDLDYLRELLEILEEKLDKIKTSIYQMSGKQFNLDSPKQIGSVLFDELRLPVMKRGKTGPSTDTEVLTQLSTLHPLPDSLLKYRELKKIKSTYVSKLLDLAQHDSGRIYTTFDQCVAATGRLVSNNPNLQNIPIKSSWGRNLRKAFIAEPKSLLLSADYSQIELRILAHFSKDETLSKWFREDKDVHTLTAGLIFNVSEDDVTDQMRDVAKTVNFGIVYGISPFGLSKQLNISTQKAKEFIKIYFQIYAKVKQYMERQVKEVRRKGYVETILGRKRYISLEGRNSRINQDSIHRIVINTPIQGSAADIIKLAMVNTYHKFLSLNLKSYMVLQIHDELIFNVYLEEQEEVLNIVKQNMESSVELRVPIKVDFKKGKNWLEMEEIHWN